jgi:hypothetical protein
MVRVVEFIILALDPQTYLSVKQEVLVASSYYESVPTFSPLEFICTHTKGLIRSI